MIHSASAQTAAVSGELVCSDAPAPEPEDLSARMRAYEGARRRADRETLRDIPFDPAQLSRTMPSAASSSK